MESLPEDPRGKFKDKVESVREEKTQLFKVAFCSARGISVMKTFFLLLFLTANACSHC